MSEQNCVLACGLGQGRLRASTGLSFTTVRLAVPEISLLAAASRNFDRCTFHALPSSAAGGGRLSDCHLHKFRLAASDVSARCRLAVPEISLLAAAREISTAARFTPCLLPLPAADVCRNVIYINFVLRHPMYRLAAALRCPKFLCSLPLRDISTAARFAPCLLPPQAADVCRNVIYINFVLRHPMYRLAAALRCPKFLCSLPLRDISTAARFTPCLLPPQAAARRETPFESPSYQKRKALL